MKYEHEYARHLPETDPTETAADAPEAPLSDKEWGKTFGKALLETAQPSSEAKREHSPLPWTLVGDPADEQAAILGNERLAKSGYRTSAGPHTVSDHIALVEGYANAAYIVKACNAYPQLETARKVDATNRRVEAGLRKQVKEYKAHAERLAEALQEAIPNIIGPKAQAKAQAALAEWKEAQE
jgi:hypothetical protein